jgi:hypothetical protein
MVKKNVSFSAAKWVAAGVVVAAASYGTLAGVTWIRYGTPNRADAEDADAVLDLFMPNYEVVDRQKIGVSAAANDALSAATELDMESCALVRGIFKGRELILRSKPDETVRPSELIAEVKSLGWGVLAELPGREIVIGAVTKPWEANPVFRAMPPAEFVKFDEPGYVKIAWTLRADSLGNGESIFRTETRAVATDPDSRKKFRRYWAFLSPGIIMIRRGMLLAVKANAERRPQLIAA